MLAMENTNSNANSSSRQGRASTPYSSFKHRRSGYEPSDTESEWHDSPWHDLKNNEQRNDSELTRTESNRSPSPVGRIQRYPSSSKLSPVRTNSIPRKNSKSPYKTHGEESNVERFENNGVSQRNTSPFAGSERTNQQISPYKTRNDDPDRHKSSNRRNNSISPYKSRKEEVGLENFESNRRKPSVSPYKSRKEEADVEIYRSNRRNNDVSPFKSRKEETVLEKNESNRRNNSISPYKSREEKENNSKSPNRRNTSPFTRNQRDLMNFKENRSNSNGRAASSERGSSLGTSEKRGAQNPTPLPARGISSKFPSEIDINETSANAKLSNGGVLASDTESISPGDIFFSRDHPLPSSNFVTANNTIPPKSTIVQQINRGSATQTSSRTSSGSVFSRQTSKASTEYSKTSEMSGGISRRESSRKFAAERQRVHSSTVWFACVRRGTCRASKSPERLVDEASFIEKAFVVEDLRPFWADKHRPSSLGGFICHKQQAQHLKQLISHNNCPHILFKGPSGAGKKALNMALLRELHGTTAWKISHDLRYFNIRQETRPTQLVLPVASSPHHVEVNLKPEPNNARHVLMALIKEIIDNPPPTPEISEANFKADYKVIVLYEVDKLAENVQHLIKWIMECYTDACKLILCCEDDTDILESVKSRCEVISVDAPVIHEIIEVLIQVARKENFDLSVSFAAKIATKSKQNLRKAIMALEACKAHNYPFVDEQPIPLGWEDVLVELAAEILADPSPKRLFLTRGKFQKLLVDFVQPKLILQKLVEQFLKGVDAGLKRELYYWHAYYDKRLPTGTSALLKLEEFVAKFMSIYRKSFVGRRYNAR